MVVQNYYQTDPRVRRKADALIEHGHAVDVIALREDNLPSTYDLSGVKVYTVPLRKQRAGRLRYVAEYAAFWSLAAALLSYLSLKHRYDVIDVNTLPDFLVFAALVPKLMRIPILLDMHEIMPEFYISKFGVPLDGWFVRVLKWQERWSLCFADSVLASNDLLAGQLIIRGLSPAKVTVIMNSADPNLFRPIGSDAAAGRNSEAPIVLMYHGTLTDIYGLDIAIDAMDRVRAQRPGLPVELHILGTGPAQDALVVQAERLGLDGRVRFLGRVPLDEVPAHIARCDAGLLPTRSDVFLELSFSNKLVEYVVMGKPVIAAGLRGYQHYFREKSLALFEPGNPTHLAQVIVDMAEQRDRWPELVANALDDYRAINWHVMGERYTTLIHSLVSYGPDGTVIEGGRTNASTV